jgi:hypothetical protein
LHFRHQLSAVAGLSFASSVRVRHRTDLLSPVLLPQMGTSSSSRRFDGLPMEMPFE